MVGLHFVHRSRTTGTNTLQSLRPALSLVSTDVRSSFVIQVLKPRPAAIANRLSLIRQSIIDNRMCEERAKRARVEQTLLSRGSVTRSALAEVLSELSNAGVLTHGLGDTSKRTTRRELQTAIEAHATSSTPYGSIVQTMDLGIKELRAWEFVNPFAYLHHLSSVSPRFAELMVSWNTK